MLRWADALRGYSSSTQNQHSICEESTSITRTLKFRGFSVCPQGPSSFVLKWPALIEMIARPQVCRDEHLRQEGMAESQRNFLPKTTFTHRGDGAVISSSGQWATFQDCEKELQPGNI